MRTARGGRTAALSGDEVVRGEGCRSVNSAGRISVSKISLDVSGERMYEDRSGGGGIVMSAGELTSWLDECRGQNLAVQGRIYSPLYISGQG